MDKYEFNIRVEQIKKMAKVGDYSGAMKAADEIDWRRVSSVSLLTLVSEIYEKNRDYSEAKEILLLAYEKAPIGKRLLYKLTMLALNEGNIPEAEAYYREFYDLAPDDSRQHILRYLILKEKGAPVDQLINSLEQYTRDELDERWMYELAELYHKAGRSEECVAMCDRVMLMFGIGKYVDRAMDLKLNREGQPLNEYQQNLIDNRDKYEARLKDMEEHPDKYDPDADAEAVEKPENYDQDNMVTEDAGYTGTAYTTLNAAAGSPVQHRAGYRHERFAESIADLPPVNREIPEEDFADTAGPADAVRENAVQAPEKEEDEIVKADISAILGGAFAGAAVKEEDEIKFDEGVLARVKAAGMQEETAEKPAEEPEEKPVKKPARKPAKRQAEPLKEEPADPAEAAGQLEAPEIIAAAAATAAAEKAEPDQEALQTQTYTDDTANTENTDTQGEEEEMTIYTVNFIVERRKEDDGVNAAIRLLKLMHEHTGSHNQVAKIKAGRLNTMGVLASREKLAGKDLVVEQAGDLAYSIVEEVMELIKTEPTERVVVLIDNPMQIRKMLSAYPELLQLFHVDKEEESVIQNQEEAPRSEAPKREAPKKAAPKREASKREETYREESGIEAPEREAAPVVRTAAPKRAAAPEPAYEDNYGDDYYEEPVQAQAPVRTQAGAMTGAPAVRQMQPDMSEEMDIDAFANYAQEYAESIDCAISGTTKLALYERIELMEEDGIKLTKDNAIALIEEAADKAEKKKLSSLFKAKYDKNDRLILREEHFVD